MTLIAGKRSRDARKLLMVVKPPKPLTEMTDEERLAFFRQIARQVKEANGGPTW